ncbi:hypothetical protein AB1N83_013989 [Pleurotus pulmonarius]
MAGAFFGGCMRMGGNAVSTTRTVVKGGVSKRTWLQQHRRRQTKALYNGCDR